MNSKKNKDKEVVLITGGAGFIGSHIIDKLYMDYNIIVIDDLSTGKFSNIIDDKSIVFIEGNIADNKFLDEVFLKFEFDYIFHLASVASVQESIKNPIFTHNINNNSTLYLLEKIKEQKKKLKRFIFSSSAAIYGDEKSLPKFENSVIAPITPYAIDKYSSEQFAIFYNKIYNLPTVVLRYFNVFGERQSYNSPYSGVLSIFAKEFINNKIPKLTIFGDGTQTRDFIYVKDVVSANILSMKNDSMIGKVYNVGLGNEVTLNGIIDIFERITNKKATISFENFRDGDIKNSVSNIDKITREGFHPEYSIEDGIRNYITYYSKRL